MSRAAKPAVAAAILVMALGLRVAEVQATPDYHPINDAAAVDVIDGHEVRRDGAIHGARIAQALLGTITVALIGLVALELFGATAGLIALGLAAVYPVDIELSTTLVAENLLTPLVLGAVYAGLRVGRAARPLTACGWVAGAGVLTGLDTLSHQNGILILLPLMVAVWKREPRSLVTPALLVLTAALMIAPWTIRNQIVVHRIVPVSDETGITLVGTYNPASAANRTLPNKWRIFYGIPGERPLIRQASRLTEPQIGDRLQSQALRYIADHPLAPLLALSVVVVNVETPRFRASVDPFLILLAAAGLATAAGWPARRLRRPPVVGEARSAVPARPAQLVEMRQRLA